MSTVTTNAVVVSVGGPLVNPVTAKYDGIALVHMAIDGRTITIVPPQGNFTWQPPTLWWNATEGTSSSGSLTIEQPVPLW